MRVFFKGSDPEKQPSPSEKPPTRRMPVVPPPDPPAAAPTENRPSTTSLSLRKHEIESVGQDLAAAAEFQKSLLPKELPALPGYDFGVYYCGAKAISGDHYDFIPSPDGRLAIVIADASGKGLTGAMLIMMARALLHARPAEAQTPEAALSWINANLHPQVKRGMFVSMTYALLDPATHALQIANAGHLPTLVWRPRAKIVTVHPARGVVLGAGGPAVFDSRLQADEINLDVGDRMLLITDGVNESMAPGQREFGMEHLRKRLQTDSDRTSADFIKNIVAQIDIHRSGGEQSDDITIVTVRRTG